MQEHKAFDSPKVKNMRLEYQVFKSLKKIIFSCKMKKKIQEHKDRTCTKNLS